MYVCTYVCMYVCTHVCTHVHTQVSMQVCMSYARTYVRTPMCMYVITIVSISISMHMFAQVPVRRVYAHVDIQKRCPFVLDMHTTAAPTSRALLARTQCAVQSQSSPHSSETASHKRKSDAKSRRCPMLLQTGGSSGQKLARSMCCVRSTFVVALIARAQFTMSRQ